MTQEIRCIPSTSLERVETWPGVARQEAIVAGPLWSGLAHLEPESGTGWHHHGAYETSLYVLAGQVRLEFGKAGVETVHAVAGDFIHVPAGLIHRELNTGSAPAAMVMTRAGEGQPMIAVDGPEP